MADEISSEKMQGMMGGIERGVADGVFTRSEQIGYSRQTGEPLIRGVHYGIGVITEEQAEKYGLQALYAAQPEWMKRGEEPPEEDEDLRTQFDKYFADNAEQLQWRLDIQIRCALVGHQWRTDVPGYDGEAVCILCGARQDRT